jgi:ferredoxin-NADP reductase
MLMHRAFRQGRRVFVSRPANHFPLREDAKLSLLFAGGIGVTPLIAMAHRLHTLGAAFELHYSAAARESAGFLHELDTAPWKRHVHCHFKASGGRADLEALIPDYSSGYRLYTCGSPRYMDGVLAAAIAHGWPEDALRREFFSVPEAPGYVNHPFRLRLLRSARTVEVPADRSATDVLAELGIRVDTKCSDGICGVCATTYDAAASGPIEHRDYVLGEKERQHRVILCCSRARDPGAEIVLDL